MAVAEHVRCSLCFQCPVSTLNEFRHAFRARNRRGLLDIALAARLILQSFRLEMIGTNNEVTFRLAHLGCLGTFFDDDESSIRTTAHEPKSGNKDFGAAQDAKRFSEVVSSLHYLARHHSRGRRGF